MDEKRRRARSPLPKHDLREAPATSLAAALALAAALGCGVNPGPPDGYLYTLDQLVPGAADGGWPLANEVVTPAGGELALLSDPYSPGAQVMQDSATDGLNIQPAFSEGQVAAYATTEVWEEWPGPVWLQPLYFPVTGIDPDTGAFQFLTSPPLPIFGVNTSSRFYSSYWQIYYVMVPPGADPSQFISVKSVLDSGYPLIEGALTFCAVGPANVNLAHAQGATGAVRPLTNDPIALRNTGTGWIEGQQVRYIDFGRSRYVRDPDASDPAVVEADALYQFAVRDPATGAPIPLDLPRVGGTGPLGQHRAPTFAGGRPEFGSLWHEYLVLLNPTSGGAPGFFVPNDHPGLRALVARQAAGQTQWAPAPDPSLDNLAPAVAAAYTLRVALNPTACFVQPNAAFPNGPCIWLDSQQAIEGNIAAQLIYDTQDLASCPLVEFADAGVAP